jgi:hypothetical protein
MTVGTVPSGLGDRARTLAGSLPAGAAAAVRRLVFCAWLAAVVGGAVVLGGADAGWFARTVDNLVLLAFAGLGAFFFAALAAIPVHLLLALVRLGWRSMPEAVFQFPAPILGVAFAAIYLGGSVEPLPLDVHPVAYGFLVVGWAAGSFFGLMPTFEVMSWFDPPRPAGARPHARPHARPDRGAPPPVVPVDRTRARRGVLVAHRRQRMAGLDLARRSPPGDVAAVAGLHPHRPLPPRVRAGPRMVLHLRDLCHHDPPRPASATWSGWWN